MDFQCKFELGSYVTHANCVTTGDQILAIAVDQQTGACYYGVEDNSRGNRWFDLVGTKNLKVSFLNDYAEIAKLAFYKEIRFESVNSLQIEEEIIKKQIYGNNSPR